MAASVILGDGLPEASRWFALQVRVRREKAVATHLDSFDFEVFLPTHFSVRQWSDRKKTIEEALFPGYVFCQFDYRRQLEILKTPGVMQVVGFGRRPVPVSDDEILSLKAAVASGNPVQPCPYLAEGQRVRIERGPLVGVEGILLNHRSGHRLVISVTLLQRSVSVEVERQWVRPVNSQPRSSPVVATNGPLLIPGRA